MPSPVLPGAPRPGNNPPPPNYNPNLRGTPDALADNMQNLNLYRPPMASNPVARPLPFGQPPPFPSSGPSPRIPGASPPFSRPGPPPVAQVRPAVPPSGPPTSTLPPNARPTGPPTGQALPFASRPPPSSVPPFMSSPAIPVSGTPNLGGSPTTHAVGPAPPTLGGRPSAFSSPTLSGNTQGIPPSSGQSNLMSNGPPAFGSRTLQGAPPFPPSVGSTLQPPVGPPSMRALPSHGMQPQLPPSSVAPQGMVPSSGSPYGPPSWPMQSQQVDLLYNLCCVRKI